MIIATILSGKGSHVVSVGPGEDIGAVCRCLAQHRIGAALVRDGSGEMLGIVSERDIVRVIARDGAAALAMTARQVMTANLHPVTPQTAVADALGMMTDRRVRHLPVMQDGRLVGMVSIGDLVKHRMAEIEFEAEELRHYVETAG